MKSLPNFCFFIQHYHASIPMLDTIERYSTKMSYSLSPLSTSSSPIYPFCNCRHHLTREHLWTNESKTDGRIFFIPNPYFERSKSKSRKPPKPGIGKPSLDTRAYHERRQNDSFCKSTNVSNVSTPKSSFMQSKYDVWNNIKSSFNQFRKLGAIPRKEKAITSPPTSKKEPVSPLDKHPFRPLPGSSNQVHLMVNPFASRNKIKAPSDELTKMFYEVIDMATEESNHQPIHSPIIEYPPSPESPISPMSPISPISTTSLHTESIPVPIKARANNSENTEYTNINPSICESNILDDILIMDFNEYEFDKMISSLPDVMDTAVSG